MLCQDIANNICNIYMYIFPILLLSPKLRYRYSYVNFLNFTSYVTKKEKENHKITKQISRSRKRILRQGPL